MCTVQDCRRLSMNRPFCMCFVAVCPCMLSTAGADDSCVDGCTPVSIERWSALLGRGALSVGPVGDTLASGPLILAVWRGASEAREEVVVWGLQHDVVGCVVC